MQSLVPNTFYRVSVKAFIQDDRGDILVLKENQDTWSLPGGGLDHAEAPIDGLTRELTEELGIINPRINGVRCVETFYLPSKQAWLMWVVYDVAISPRPLALGDGVNEARYIAATSLHASPDIFEQMAYKASREMK